VIGRQIEAAGEIDDQPAVAGFGGREELGWLVGPSDPGQEDERDNETG